jgi:hypothetical protein
MKRTTQAFAVAAALVLFATVGLGVVANIGKGRSSVLGFASPATHTLARPIQESSSHPTPPKKPPSRPNSTASTASTFQPTPGQPFWYSSPENGFALSGPAGSCGASSAAQPHDAGWVKITRKQAESGSPSASPSPEPSPATASTETDVTVEIHLTGAMPAAEYMVWLIQLDGYDCVGSRELGLISTDGAAPFDQAFDASVAPGISYQVILTEDGAGIMSDSAFVTNPQVFLIN